MAGSGHCTHPERQSDSTLRLLVRSRELACRNSWGGDLFVSKDADHAQRPDPATHHSNPTPTPSAVDDEVTSVVTPRVPRSPNGSTTGKTGDDRVVSDRPAPNRDNQREEDDDENDAARQDQDERARMIFRDPPAAIARAKARHLDRKRKSHAGTDSVASAPEGKDDDPDDATRSVPPKIPNTGTDQVVTQKQRLSHRFTRGKSTEVIASEHDLPVPRSEVAQHRDGESGNQDRFDSIPDIDPNFDLPGWRQASHLAESPADQDAGDPDRESAEITGQQTDDVTGLLPDNRSGEGAPPKTYEHVLSRARRIRESKKLVRPHPRPAAGGVAPNDAYPEYPPHEPRVVNENHEEIAASALPPLLDEDLQDESGRILADDAGSLTSEHKEERAESAQSQRRRSWLARFGIHRDGAYSDELAADPDASQEYHEAYGGGELNGHVDVEPAEHPYSTSADSNRASDTEYHHESGHGRGDDQESPSYELPETYSGNTYYSELDDGSPPDRWHATAEQPSIRAGLPDLDAILATASPRSASRTPDDAGSELSQADRRGPPAGTYRAAPEQHIAASRWSGDASPSPRESFFRARRFSDWDDGHPERHAIAKRTHYADKPDLSTENRDDDDHGRDRALPDLDAGSFDLRDVIERGGELMDMRIDVAPDIPRACRTCRSFRSADGGARGWCTNEWAFTHRRMVNEDDVACETTIGSWWLPDDRYWLAEDFDDWADATPRMDAFLARGVAPPNRRISGE